MGLALGGREVVNNDSLSTMPGFSTALLRSEPGVAPVISVTGRNLFPVFIADPPTSHSQPQPTLKPSPITILGRAPLVLHRSQTGS